MIYTVTFNPSLDYIVGVDDFKLGVTNRTTYEQMLAGGKGINVSYVLKNLGFESTALGFLAGFVGEELRKRLTEDGIRADFLELEDGISRINVKLKSIDGTEINGMGPDIAPDKVKALRDKINELKAGDILILAGSIPQTMPDTIYMDIMADLQGKGVDIVVDATRDLLMNVLSYKPFLSSLTITSLARYSEWSLKREKLWFLTQGSFRRREHAMFLYQWQVREPCL